MERRECEPVITRVDAHEQRSKKPAFVACAAIAVASFLSPTPSMAEESAPPHNAALTHLRTTPPAEHTTQKVKLTPPQPPVELGSKVTFGDNPACEFTCLQSPPNFNHDTAFRYLSNLKGTGNFVLRLAVDERVISSGRPMKPCDPKDITYNWAALDSLVQESNDKRFTILLNIVNTPRWIGPSNMPQPAADLANFACAVAKRYNGNNKNTDSTGRELPKVLYYEMENEPNLITFANPTLIYDPATRSFPYKESDMMSIYSKEFEAADASIMSVNPNAVVSPAGISNQGTIPMQTFMEGMDSQVYQEAGAFSVHFYPFAPTDTPAQSVVGTEYEGKDLSTTYFYDNYKLFLTELSRLAGGKNLPVWFTEIGWFARPNSTSELNRQAADMAMTAKFAEDPSNDAEMILDYSELNDPSKFQTGLVNYRNYPKNLNTVASPAYNVWKAAVSSTSSPVASNKSN